MKVLVIAAIFGVFAIGCSGHQLKWGSCKSVSGMTGFDPDRFSGKWYVIKKLVTSSPCMMAKFGMEAENVLTVQELRTPVIGQLGPLDMSVTNVGKLVMDPSNKADMALYWDGNPLKDMLTTKYNILDTDYDNYALDLECQSLTIFHRLSATIYSRTPLLPQSTIERLEKMLMNHRVNLDRMSTIDHTNCLPIDNNDFNVMVDDNGLSLLGLMKDEDIKSLETINQVGEYARANVPVQ